MTEKVVALHGGEVIQAAIPRESVIEHLERVLERARAGEVQGIAVVCLHSDQLTSWELSGVVTGSHSFIGACAKLFYRVCRFDDD